MSMGHKERIIIAADILRMDPAVLTARLLGEDPTYGIWRPATEGEAADWHAGYCNPDGLEYRETDHGLEVRES